MPRVIHFEFGIDDPERTIKCVWLENCEMGRTY